MLNHALTSAQDLEQTIQTHPACALYFSQSGCGVCQVLEPKLEALFAQTFPHIPFFTVDSLRFPELPAQKSVFTVPTLLVFFEQSEFLRESRHISLPAVQQQLSRPYDLLFTE